MPRCYMVKKSATKYQDETQDSEGKTPGPKSPTEASMAPSSPAYYRNLDVANTMSNGKYLIKYVTIQVMIMIK